MKYTVPILPNESPEDWRLKLFSYALGIVIDESWLDKRGGFGKTSCDDLYAHLIQETRVFLNKRSAT